MNATLIPSQSQGNPGGFVYTWEDRANLVPGTTYYYWVEDVDIYGTATMHGPVSVDYTVPLRGPACQGQASPAAAGSALPWLLAAAGAGLALAGGAAQRRRQK